MVAEGINYLLPFSIPPSILGLVLMLLLLQFRVIKLEHVEEASKFLLEIITMIFIPTSVGLINYYDFIKSYWVRLLIVILVSCVLVIIVTGRVTQSLIRVLHNTGERKSQV